jgi:hypothetical protein
VGVRYLREQGYPEEVLDAIMGHADYTGVPRETPLAKALYACDELTGSSPPRHSYARQGRAQPRGQEPQKEV